MSRACAAAQLACASPLRLQDGCASVVSESVSTTLLQYELRPKWPAGLSCTQRQHASSTCSCAVQGRSPRAQRPTDRADDVSSRNTFARSAWCSAPWRWPLASRSRCACAPVSPPHVAALLPRLVLLCLCALRRSFALSNSVLHVRRRVRPRALQFVAWLQGRVHCRRARPRLWSWTLPRWFATSPPPPCSSV